MRYLNIAILCLVLLVATAASAKTYRWVDADGVVHYSDSPRPGSKNPQEQEIDIQAVNVIKSRPPRPAPARSASESQDEASEASFAYRTLRVVAPGDGDTLWNIGGNLNVSVQVSPGLRPNHGVVFVLDGKQATAEPVTGTSATLGEVYRGEHRLTAIVRSADGQDLITSAPVRFYVRQRGLN